MGEDTSTKNHKNQTSGANPEMNSMRGQVFWATLLIPMFIIFRFAVWRVHCEFNGGQNPPESNLDQFKEEICEFWSGINPNHSLGESYGVLIAILALVISTVLVLIPFSRGNQFSSDRMIQKIEHVLDNMCLSCVLFIPLIFPELEKPFGFLIALLAVYGSIYLIVCLDEYVIGGLRRKESIAAQDQRIDSFTENYEELEQYSLKKGAGDSLKKGFVDPLKEDVGEKVRFWFHAHPMIPLSAVFVLLNFIALNCYEKSTGILAAVIVEFLLGILITFFSGFLEYTYYIEKRAWSSSSLALRTICIITIFVMTLLFSLLPFAGKDVTQPWFVFGAYWVMIIIITTLMHFSDKTNRFVYPIMQRVKSLIDSYSSSLFSNLEILIYKFSESLINRRFTADQVSNIRDILIRKSDTFDNNLLAFSKNELKEYIPTQPSKLERVNFVARKLQEGIGKDAATLYSSQDYYNAAALFLAMRFEDNTYLESVNAHNQSDNKCREKMNLSESSRIIEHMRIAAGMVTFNPSLDDLRASVPALLKQVEALVVVDNGSGNVDDVASFVAAYPQVTLLRNGKNLGVAAALNRVFEWAEKSGFDWVLTLDDDSEIPEGMIDGYRRCLQDRQDRQEDGAKVGIVCPLLINRKDGTVFHSKRNESECITSGSLTNVAAWRAIGGFDDWLFIDGVDFDFSRRLMAAGYPIVECKAVVMPHQIGESRTVNLGFKHPIAWNHAPFRWYYIQRNALYIDKKLGAYSWPHAVIRITGDMLIVLLFERDKGKKIGAMLRGWRAGKRKIRGMNAVASKQAKEKIKRVFRFLCL